jgi:predicted dehydrogenase
VNGTRVIGLAASRLERAEAAARPYGIDAYSDYRVLLDRRDVHIVAIATPPAYHTEMTLAALERGKHVLCEKPFTLNALDAEMLLKRAEAAGVIHALGFEQRYLPERQAMKTLVAEGRIGQARLFSGLVTHRRFGAADVPVRSWSVLRDELGGALAGIGIHLVDYLLWLFGEVKRVSAHLRTVVLERKVEGDGVLAATGDDMASVTIEFVAPLIATFLTSWAAGEPEQRIESTAVPAR